MDQSEENKKSEIARERPRDYHGHFIHEKPSPEPPVNTPPLPPPLPPPPQNFIKNNTNVSRTHDDKTLIDLHIGNPLRRVTELLEDIKRQKAFSFTLKGSLGLTGVVLALSVLGFFGTTHALCDKGTQSQLGTIRVLQVLDSEPVSFMDNVTRTIDYYKQLIFRTSSKKDPQRIVLVTPMNTMVRVLTNSESKPEKWSGQFVVVTGDFDTCTQTIKLKSPNAIERN